MRFGRKATAAIMAGLMAVSTTVPAGVALAANANEPSAGNQTGTGKTDLTMILQNGTTEYGGTEDPTNPDTNPADNLGDNLAFTVPSSINYVIQADGDLIGPSTGVAFIENRSSFEAHVSSVQVDSATPANGSAFAIVSDVDADTAGANPTANAVELHFGPATDQLNASDYATKAAVSDPTAWNMAATNGAHTSTSDRSDEVQIATSGKVAHLTNDVTNQTKFGEIHWYLTAGRANNAAQELHTYLNYVYTPLPNAIAIDDPDREFYMADGQTFALAVTDSLTTPPSNSEQISIWGTELEDRIGDGETITWADVLDFFHLTPADVNGKCVWIWVNT